MSGHPLRNQQRKGSPPRCILAAWAALLTAEWMEGNVPPFPICRAKPAELMTASQLFANIASVSASLSVAQPWRMELVREATSGLILAGSRTYATTVWLCATSAGSSLQPTLPVTPRSSTRIARRYAYTRDLTKGEVVADRGWKELGPMS